MGLKVKENSNWVDVGKANPVFLPADADFKSISQDNTIFSYIGVHTDVVLPSHIDGVALLKFDRMFWESPHIAMTSIYCNNPLTSAKESFRGNESIKNLILKINTTNITSFQYMFMRCSEMETLDISSFVTSNAKAMDSLFAGCTKLKSLDVSHFDTSEATDLDSMFSGCASLTSLDVTNFDTSKCSTMPSIFRDCTLLTNLDLTNFNTSRVFNMFGMFAGCSSLEELDLSSFDTARVTAMNKTFEGCSSLVNLDLSSFDVTKVTEMTLAFSECSKLVKVWVKDAYAKEKFETLPTGTPAQVKFVIK